MAGFLKYLDEFESGVAVPRVVPKPKVVAPKVVAPIVETVIASDDDYLSESGWKVRGNTWIDPITKNLLIWEAAYAVQQERERVDVIVEKVVHRPVTQQKAITKPKAVDPMDMASRASSILDGTEWEDDSGVAESFASSLPELPMVGDVPVVYDSPMSAEEQMFAEAQQSYSNGSGGGDPNMYRTKNDGLGMVAMVDDLFI